MSKYEVVFIVDARLSDGEKKDVAKLVTDLIAKLGGKAESKVWLERQRMAFSIGKAWEGTYYLLNVEMNWS